MYETSIPDAFEPPQFRDEKFNEALATLKAAGISAKGPNVLALARPELDPSSRVHYSLGTGSHYEVKAKTDKVAMMHVVSVGRGRVRLGFREHIPVSEGDMILVNLREAGHWLFLEGILFYTFTGDVAMASVYRTTKPLTPPPAEDREARAAWHDELFWNLHKPLNDYVVLGRDPKAEIEMRNGPNKLIEPTEQSMSDGTRSDDGRDSRFQIVYRRVLGAGPGRRWRREIDGLPDYEFSAPEVVPGDMMSFTTAVRAADFVFQGMPLQIAHAGSVLVGKLPPHVTRVTGAENIAMHESCAKPIPWDVETELDPDEDAQLRGLSG